MDRVVTNVRGINSLRSALAVAALIFAFAPSHAQEIRPLPSLDGPTITLDPVKSAVEPDPAISTEQVPPKNADPLESAFSRAYQNMEFGPRPKPRKSLIRVASAELKLNPTEENDQDNQFPVDPESTLTLPIEPTSDPQQDNALVDVIRGGPASDSFESNSHIQLDDPIWWSQRVVAPLFAPESNQAVNANSLVYEAIKNSPRIRAISQNPLIRELQVIEADSEFDPVSYVQTQFDDRVDPVGDNLSITNDGSLFLQDHIWTGNLGVRRKYRTGAQVDFGQQIGFRNSNSSFFNPQDQGTATISVNVTQPLLRGRGRYYNESQILIAQASGEVAWNAFASELQDELLETVAAYWQLYYARSVFLQKHRNVYRGEKILELLEGRAVLDSLPSQIARARSAVKSRQTDLANAFRDIRDAETEIRRLTADKNWLRSQHIELVPAEQASIDTYDLALEPVVASALKNRPEIGEAMKRVKIAAVQRDISVNELLPELSFLVGSYISALRGESQVFEAIGDQFSGIKPGYNVGLEFEMPIWNRAARSRLAQRKLQFTKISAEVDEIMQNVVAESQVSLRRVTSAKETVVAAKQAIMAAHADLEQNVRRWESFALVEGDLADGQTPTTLLDQLLDSQERLTTAELVYSQAELDLKTAEVELQRTMGTLLIYQNVNFNKSISNDTPSLRFETGGNQVPLSGPIPQ